MTDLSQTIAPKSDQLNADDLIAGPRTIKVVKVSRASDPDQPVAISFEGDNGKPYKPCKSMRRVLISVWGADGASYAGRRMTLYCDKDVMFGGMKVGGIRISHVSDIERDVTMALTVTRAKRSPYTVKPIAAEAKTSSRDRLFAAARAEAGKGVAALVAFRSGLDPRANTALDAISHELNQAAQAVDGNPDRDPEPGEVRGENGADSPAEKEYI
jgi:hypothetical protein